MDKLEKSHNYTKEAFEDIKHIDEDGVEFWYARELQEVLDYKEWRKFENVIKKAKQSCENSAISVFEHFVGVDKLSKRANNAEIEIKDYKLTRYACYLIAQNGDSRKKVIALAQTCFIIFYFYLYLLIQNYYKFLSYLCIFLFLVLLCMIRTQYCHYYHLILYLYHKEQKLIHKKFFHLYF